MLLSVAVGSGCLGTTQPAPPSAPIPNGPPALPEGDEDGDGILDAVEQALAERFAPIVILDPHDTNRPASIPWLLERVSLPSDGATTFRLPPSARGGSNDPADWTTYVHVYPRPSGGLHLQYWFFYPYNTGRLVFDHDGDWEHLTVDVDEDERPIGAFLARHSDDRPGAFRPWSRLVRKGDHPVVLSARGSHATYADRADLAIFERAASCDDLDHCDAPMWRTWEGGGLVNVGERSRPLVLHEALTYRGRWGRSRLLPGTSAPFGPLSHRGFCVDAFASCDAPRPAVTANLASP